jgi:hypothetical protein
MTAADHSVCAFCIPWGDVLCIPPRLIGMHQQRIIRMSSCDSHNVVATLFLRYLSSFFKCSLRRFTNHFLCLCVATRSPHNTEQGEIPKNVFMVFEYLEYDLTGLLETRYVVTWLRLAARLYATPALTNTLLSIRLAQRDSLHPGSYQVLVATASQRSALHAHQQGHPP